jgi:CRISPR-associated endonuclease Csn1
MKVWGFDIGTTSIGFAVISQDLQSQTGSIERLGVRIFPEGVTEKDKEPRNTQRRTKRLMRRQLRRRKLRRKLLNESLADAGLLPQYGTPAWTSVMALDPYALRAKGMKEALTGFELGRALYHLAKHRHFRGRAIIDDDKKREHNEDKEEKKIRQAAAALESKLAGKTLGAWLSEQPKKRGHHATRELVEGEFARLVATQTSHHLIFRDEAFKARIEHLIFFQRPTFWRLATLGTCPLMPGEELAARGDWSTQQHELLDQVNKLRIAGGNARPLNAEERKAILMAIDGKRTLTWGGVRKALKPLWKEYGESQDQKFNLETGGERELKGNIVEAELAKIFSDEWKEHPDKEKLRATVHRRLYDCDYVRIGNSRVEIRKSEDSVELRGKLAEQLQSEFRVSAEQAANLCALELPTGWRRLSAKAITIMRPKLEEGIGVGQLLMSPEYETWRQQNFPDRSGPTGEIVERLPAHAKAMPQVRNPTVTRCLNELRKVVNNLLAVHGRPDVIRIELAREVGKPARVRNDINTANRDRERHRKAAAADLEANGIGNPSDHDIEKWLLWKESKERCPYTGDHIGFDDLFRNGRYEVEHIWPRQRSLDNRMANKTLCRRDINIKKGNRTPWEMYHGNSEDWEKIVRRLPELGLTEGKIKRFTHKNVAQAINDEWAERQLRDTSYAAREARDFLARLWPDDGRPTPVETVNGRVTADLRKRWGLNYLLGGHGKKNRADHRHHAVDALAVACTTRGFVKRLSDYYAADDPRGTPHLPKPWSTIREDAAKAIERVVVSYRVDRKLSGSLHEEMPLGLTSLSGESGGSNWYTRRKGLHLLSDTEVENIRDGAIRALVQERAPTAVERKKLESDPIRLPHKGDSNGRTVKKARLLYKLKPNAVFKLRAPPKTYAELGQVLHHIAIYRRSDGSMVHVTRTRLQALAAQRETGCPVLKTLEDGSRLVASLCRQDILERLTDDGDKEYLVVRKCNQAGRIFYKPATSAEEPKPEVSFGPQVFKDARIRKVTVDPIGRVRPASD